MTNQNVPERTSHAIRESYFLTTWIIQSLNCIIYLPRQCGTLYAPQASNSCYNFCHIPGKYVSHVQLRHPPCCPSNDLQGVWSRKRKYGRPSLFRPPRLWARARTGSRTGFCSYTVNGYPWRIIVYILCFINICLSLSYGANKTNRLNIERP